MTDAVAQLSFSFQSTGSDLYLDISLDGTVIYQGYPCTEPQTILHDFVDSDQGDHLLCFEMQGKRAEHTVVSATGEILQDQVIKIGDLALDGINLGHLFYEHTRYYHDTNSTTEPVVDQFFGVMGCNGRVEMRFTSPIYLWLLENM